MEANISTEELNSILSQFRPLGLDPSIFTESSFSFPDADDIINNPAGNSEIIDYLLKYYGVQITPPLRLALATVGAGNADRTAIRNNKNELGSLYTAFVKNIETLRRRFKGPELHSMLKAAYKNENRGEGGEGAKAAASKQLEKGDKLKDPFKDFQDLTSMLAKLDVSPYYKEPAIFAKVINRMGRITESVQGDFSEWGEATQKLREAHAGGDKAKVYAAIARHDRVVTRAAARMNTLKDEYSKFLKVAATGQFQSDPSTYDRAFTEQIQVADAIGSTLSTALGALGVVFFPSLVISGVIAGANSLGDVIALQVASENYVGKASPYEIARMAAQKNKDKAKDALKGVKTASKVATYGFKAATLALKLLPYLGGAPAHAIENAAKVLDQTNAVLVEGIAKNTVGFVSTTAGQVSAATKDYQTDNDLRGLEKAGGTLLATGGYAISDRVTAPAALLKDLPDGQPFYFSDQDTSDDGYNYTTRLDELGTVCNIRYWVEVDKDELLAANWTWVTNTATLTAECHMTLEVGQGPGNFQDQTEILMATNAIMNLEIEVDADDRIPRLANGFDTLEGFIPEEVPIWCSRDESFLQDVSDIEKHPYRHYIEPIENRNPETGESWVESYRMTDAAASNFYEFDKIKIWLACVNDMVAISRW